MLSKEREVNAFVYTSVWHQCVHVDDADHVCTCVFDNKL